MEGTKLEFTFLSNLESKANRITKETLRTVLPLKKVDWERIKQRALELTCEETEKWDDRNKMEHPHDEGNQKRTKAGNKSQPKVYEKAEEIYFHHS